MHDELGCGTSRSVVNNYIRITRNAHMENAKGRNEKKKNQKWIILIRDYSIEKEK